MKKLRLYLDTSVWNFVFADDAPEFQKATIEFFKNLPDDPCEIFISETVLAEINDAQPETTGRLLKLIESHGPIFIDSTEEIRTLADQYIAQGVLSVKMKADALHVAHATIQRLDAVVSWNLKHLANLRRQQRINEINVVNGYTKPLSLITPMEVRYVIES